MYHLGVVDLAEESCWVLRPGTLCQSSRVLEGTLQNITNDMQYNTMCMNIYINNNTSNDNNNDNNNNDNNNNNNDNYICMYINTRVLISCLPVASFVFCFQSRWCLAIFGVQDFKGRSQISFVSIGILSICK
jgi:hypothetical protein